MTDGGEGGPGAGRTGRVGTVGGHRSQRRWVETKGYEDYEGAHFLK